MSEEQETETQSLHTRSCISSQSSVVAKREKDKSKEKTVSFLDDFVCNHDAESILTLAKYCTLGVGIEQNLEGAKMLVSASARMGNREAQSLMALLNKWKGKHCVDWRRL